MISPIAVKRHISARLNAWVLSRYAAVLAAEKSAGMPGINLRKLS
jgi:hypothetical protein